MYSTFLKSHKGVTKGCLLINLDFLHCRLINRAMRQMVVLHTHVNQTEALDIRDDSLSIHFQYMNLKIDRMHNQAQNECSFVTSFRHKFSWRA